MTANHRQCKTLKRQYHDEAEAKRALTRVRQSQDKRERTPDRTYQCPHCHYWHLSAGGKPDRPGLKRTGFKVGRRRRLKPRSDKREAELPERRAVREAVLKRDGHKCRIAPFFPDQPCRGDLNPHHLVKEGQSGPYTEENLITACNLHNDMVEDHPDYAKKMGLVKLPPPPPPRVERAPQEAKCGYQECGRPIRQVNATAWEHLEDLPPPKHYAVPKPGTVHRPLPAPDATVGAGDGE